MSNSSYLESYQEATRLWARGYGDRGWESWVKDLVRIKQAWTQAVNGMLAEGDRDDPEICYALGDAYQWGHGVERDVAQGEIWLRKAAATGHLRSMTRLGTLLSHHERTDVEKKEAIEWYQKAAVNGDSYGMMSLGFSYREGRGVELDQRKAIDWFIKAHHAGAKNAAEPAGRLLSFQIENHLEAVKWLRIAAESGSTIAYADLAEIYENRKSPAYSPEVAFQCWLQVAERPQGGLRFLAMFKLAYCYRDGCGTVRSREEAKRWLDRILTVAPNDKSDYRQASKLRREIDEELF